MVERKKIEEKIKKKMQEIADLDLKRKEAGIYIQRQQDALKV